MTEAMSELGAIFPACASCGRALYVVPGGDGNTSHIERDAVTLACEERLTAAEEYEFTAKQIREAYVRPPGIFGHYGMENRAAEFDRWLAAHDREVAAASATARFDELNELFLHMRDRVSGWSGAPPVAWSFQSGAAAFEWAAANVRYARDGQPLLNPPVPAAIREEADRG